MQLPYLDRRFSRRSRGKRLILMFTGCWSETSEPKRSEQRHGSDGRDSNDDETDDLRCCETRVLDDVVADPAGKVLPLGVAKSLGEGSEGRLGRLEGGVCCVVHGLLCFQQHRMIFGDLV